MIEVVAEQYLEMYRVTPIGVELFGELEQPSGEALRSLARATLADEAHEALHGRPPAVSEAAELGRHTRMVAHELRNILVPVQLTLKQLRRQGSGEGFVTENAGSLDNIASGLERALRFATDTARVTSQGTSRDELFAAEAAVRDAIVAVESDLRHPVEFESTAGVERVYLRGRRERFVLAILNLLRNASQAGGVEVRIFVRAEMTGGTGARLVVMVEDDGPGVPVEQQAAIFADGVSFRAGGSGHGLALVRGVVEDELRGSIHYEPSQRGGARFVLRLPIPLEGVT
ncbi:sensor histidine kinase [Nannocystis pusilla]|uniref:histidine kinase n=1 Tax=Nannocystis pusilla TaxID=889268 RepID=A0ABS7TT64_9BACT|nr:sensor histidine kinase [Nannocystis pusilla]MBZ5711411.1 sensor histidine kinase [Nannocystis pusilla]